MCLADTHSKGIIRIVDLTSPSNPGIQTVDIVKLKETFKLQPRGSIGRYLHLALSGAHADIYMGPHEKEHASAVLTGSKTFSGAISQMFVPASSGALMGFRGSIVGSGGIGSMNVWVTSSGLTISATDSPQGTLYVGSVATRSG